VCEGETEGKGGSPELLVAGKRAGRGGEWGRGTVAPVKQRGRQGDRGSVDGRRRRARGRDGSEEDDALIADTCPLFFFYFSDFSSSCGFRINSGIKPSPEFLTLFLGVGEDKI
jgi:hypothetical protein